MEFALLAPVLMLLAVLAWDGGSILREQVILQAAARDGARVAATGYGTSVSLATVSNAVLESVRDLQQPPSAVLLNYPDALSAEVVVRYDHELYTPVLRQLWSGGTGILQLEARATFYLPRETAVPATIVPSTPIPTPTPTPTSTATPTNTPVATSTPTATTTPTAALSPTATATPALSPTATSTPMPTATATATSTSTSTSTPVETSTPTATSTATPTGTPSPTATPTSTPTPTATSTPTPTPTPGPCTDTLAVPALSKDWGWYYTFTSAGAGTIQATWTLPVRRNLSLYIYAGTPFVGANPTNTAPPGGWVAMQQSNNVFSLTASTGVVAAGAYTVYFYNRGGTAAPAGTGTVQYVKATCP